MFIARVDLDSNEEHLYSNFAHLQGVLTGVAFCSVNKEFPDNDASEDIVKVFRLAQFIIRYLLQSQDKLSETLSAVQRNNDALRKEYAKMEKRLSKREMQIRSLSQECRKRRKLIEQQQNTIYQGKDPTQFQKVTLMNLLGVNLDFIFQCHLCPKTFVNKSFLSSHLARRHNYKREFEDDVKKK